MSRILCGIACLILAGTAAFHATGYKGLVQSLATSSLPDLFRQAIPGIWLFFSWHLIAVATAAGWAAIHGSSSARPLVIFCAFVVCVDTAFVYITAGFFAGTILLFAAAICLITASFRWK